MGFFSKNFFGAVFPNLVPSWLWSCGSEGGSILVSEWGGPSKLGRFHHFPSFSGGVRVNLKFSSLLSIPSCGPGVDLFVGRSISAGKYHVLWFLKRKKWGGGLQGGTQEATNLPIFPHFKFSRDFLRRKHVCLLLQLTEDLKENCPFSYVLLPFFSAFVQKINISFPPCFTLQTDDDRLNKASELSLANVGGVFVVLLAGMGLACLIAVFEFIWKSRYGVLFFLYRQSVGNLRSKLGA